MAFKKKNRSEDDTANAGGVATVANDRDANPGTKNSHTSTVTASGGHNGAGPRPGAPDSPIAEGRQIRLGEQLIGSHLITEEQLDQALAMQRDAGGRLGEVLVSLGALSEQSLAHALAAFFGYEVANLRRDVINPNILTLVTEEVARENMAFPVRLQDDDVLSVAVAEPSEELRAILSKASGKSVQLVIAPLGDIRWAIDSNYHALGNVDKLVKAFESVEGSAAPYDRDVRARDCGRRRSRRPSCGPDLDAGHARSGLGRAHRTG